MEVRCLGQQRFGGDVRLGQTNYAYIDGSCQGWLPRGDVIVEAVRGYEYEPLRQTITIAGAFTGSYTLAFNGSLPSPSLSASASGAQVQAARFGPR